MPSKNLLLKLPILICTLLYVLSCNDENSFKEDFDINEIKTDSVFINYINCFVQYVDGINETSNLMPLLSDDELTDDELEIVSKALGFQNFKEYEKYFNEQKKRTVYLENRYRISLINSDTYESLALETIELNGIISERGLRTNVEDKCNCDRKFRNCVTIVTVETLAAHTACFAADLTVIGGIVCHGAAAIYQAASLDNCAIEKSECFKNCNQQ